MLNDKAPYQNQLHEIYSDCLLPKFTVPHLSTAFDPDSLIYQKQSAEFATNAVLGIDLSIDDMSQYWKNQDIKDEVVEEDLIYMPNLVRTESKKLVMPTIAIKDGSNKQYNKEQKSKADEHTTYKKSPFFKNGKDDEAIKEQLANAFNNNVPDGEVHMVKKARVFSSFRIHGAENLPLDVKLFLSKDKRFIKYIPNEESGNEPVTPVRGYKVVNEPLPGTTCYYKVDENGDYHIGIVNNNTKLRPLPAIEIKKEQMLSTPIIIKKDEE